MSRSKFLTPVLLLGIVALLLGVSLGPIYIGPLPNYASSWKQEAHIIVTVMYAYAEDHDQLYPTGDSSTQVFQELMDGGYITDPNVFYIPLPGKTPPVAGKKLKPENVSWDVTSGVDTDSPDGIPVVFMTGYRVTYEPGATARASIKPYPRYDQISWELKWRYRALTPDQYTPPLGIAVAYKDDHAQFLPLDLKAHPDGSIPNFIPPEVKPDHKPYRQLTPNGAFP
jgi:hypothetical protein